MVGFPLKRALAAVTHAGLAVSAYLLVRQSEERLTWSTVDSVVCVATAAAILVLWWRHRNETDPVGDGFIGLKALGLVAALGFASIFLVALAQLATWGGVRWYATPTAILFVALLIHVAIGTVVGGVVASALFHLVVWRSGKAGLFLGPIFAVLSLAVPVVAVVTHRVADMAVVDFFMRYDELRPFPAEVLVDLEVKGTPIKIARVVSCHRLTTGPERRRWIERRVGINEPRWVPELKSFGQVFEDGSGIFVITPDACQNLARAQKPGTEGLGPDYLPLIGWTPNSAVLDTFDLFVDATALASQGSPITLRAVTIRRLPFGTPVSPPDAFARIGWQDESDRGVKYRAVFATAIPRERWSTDPEVAAALDTMTIPGYVLGDLARARSKSRNPWLETERNTTCWIGRKGEGIPARSNDKYGPVFPILHEDGNWIAAREKRGVLTFYQLPGNRWDATLPTAVVVRGQRIARHDGDSAFAPAYIFDPSLSELWRLSFVVCSTAAPKDPSASHQ